LRFAHPFGAVTTFYLIRHGENDLVGQAIAGRAPGIRLNALGRRQAEVLAGHLAHFPIHQVLTSPLERARETAEPLARRLGLPLQVCAGLIEVDFGDWTGKPIAELDRMELWKKWNSLRSAGWVPNGESMLQVQARLVAEVERLRRLHPDQQIVLVTHGDPIRALITYYLGMPLDMLLRIEVSSASISSFSIDDWQVRFHLINYTPPLEGLPET
jgi:probable phosphoglycerate mutase